VPKGRPRMTKTGHTYTPKRTVDYEKQVGLVAFLVMQQQGLEPIAGSVTASIHAVFKRPKKPVVDLPWPKQDLDNVVKTALDGINGVCYEDDRQVISLRAAKTYAPDGGDGYLDVTIMSEE